MRLMQWHRQPWRVDLAFLLTLCLLFLPAWVGLQPGNEARVAAQPPAPVAARPILVVPFQAAEGVPTGVTEGVTFALVEELEASRQLSPTRLSLDEPTIQRLIREWQLTEDAVTDVLQQPTPEGIAQIASAMKVADAVYGTVDSYTYDPQANGGVVRVKVTARFLKVDPTTGAVTETKEISKEGSSAPKLAPRPEKELASEAFRNAVRQIVSEFLGLPAPPPPPPPPKAISPLPVLIGLLLLGALIGAGRGRAAPTAPPIAPGPANAPSRVTAFPQGQAILVTWQIPVQGTPLGYNVYRADVGVAPSARQADNFQRLNTAPIQATRYLDTQVVPGRLYLYAVTAVYPNNVESERAFANADITGQPAPVGIGVPLPPRNLQAQPGDSLVRLTWEDPNPSGIVRGYRIYRGTNAPPTDANLIADETTVRTTTFTDRGLSNGTTYFYVVRAVSTQNFLSVPSAVVPATPGNLPPQAPTLSGQFNPATFTVTLSWTPPPDPDIAYYEVARIVKDISRSRALTTRVTRQTPIINLSPGVARRILQTNPRLRQTASEFDAHVIARNITATSFVDNEVSQPQFKPSGTAPTIYKELHYAVRAVDQSGQRSPWSNVVVITPNSPPPSLATLRPKVIPGNGQVTIDLLPLLTAANQDPQFGSEWQVDKKGVRIFRTTTKGGTSAAALPPINSPDPLPLENLQNGRFFRDTQVSNGTRYFYAVELVDKLGVAGRRSPEAVATPFATATITITSLRRELSGNGQDSVQLTIAALDAASRPVAGLPLKVTLQGVGTLTVNPQYDDPYSDDPSDAITDDSGQIIATYRAAVISADTTVTITAAPNPLVTGVSSAQLTLTLRAPVVASVEIQPQQTQLVADGQSFTRVAITVRDRLGSPMPNQTVALSVSPAQGRFEDLNGNPITQVSTGTTGVAEVIYRSGTRAGSVTLTASVGAISGQAVITLIPGSPATIELVANPSVAKADGQTEVSVTATVRDANNNAVPNVQVQFSAVPALNILQPTVTTDSSGQATTTIVAPTEVGTYILFAKVGTISRSIVLQFTAEVPTITLKVEPLNLFVSKKQDYSSFDDKKYPNTAKVTVEAKGAGGEPFSNVTVILSASDPASRWKVNNQQVETSTVVLTTDNEGKAEATYVASPWVGQVTITAKMGDQVQLVTINQLPGLPQVTVSANPESVFVRLAGAQYGVLPQQSQITVKVADENGNPHPNASVLLTTTGGTLAASSGQTDSQGQFTTTLTAPTQVPAGGKVTVTANVTTTRGERPDPQTKDVAVQPGPPAIVELSATKLTLSETDSATITATVKDANGNPVPSGSGRTVSVTFALQVSQANSGKVTLNPTSGTTNNNGQVLTTLTTNNAVADTARVTAEAVETLQSTFFRASNQLVIPVGITATLTDLQIATQTLVVSNSNVADPTQRQPLDPAKQNRTLVTVKVSLSSAATSDVSIPVLLLSSDDNTLWQDVANTSRFALKQLTLFVAIPSGQNQGTAQAFFYTSTKRALNIAGEPAVAIRATLDPNFTDFNQPDQAGISITKSGANGIIQQPGPPATIALDFLGFARAADNVPYLTVNPSNPPTGNITATVRDAVGNPVNGITVNFALSPTNLGSDAGTFTDSNNQTSTGTTDNNGQVTKTLQASNLTTEVTLQVQSGNASATQPIRYSIALSALNITPNPTTIPDDGTTTSLITITGTPNLPNNLKFRLSADLGATLSAGTEGTDQPSLILTVGNGEPTGEGSNQARAILKGPNPDLSQTQPRTITLTANLIVDGLPRTFTQTVTLLPRIQIASNFGLSNNPNRLVVSSSNDTDQTRRVPLDTVAGHNKATIIVTLNGSATPNPSFVTFTSNDPNILFVEVNPSNNQETTNKALGNLSVNFVPIEQDSKIVGWQAIVNLYASTTAASNLVVQIGVLGVTRSIIFEQVPGLPAIVTVSPDRSVIGVTGHPTLPTSTAVRAIIRDAAGNLVTQPGVTVTFTADAGTLNPTSAPAVNGVATTTLTSTNATRQVRVIARATAGNAEAVGAATIVFAVGSVSNITLTTDKPQDAQGRVLLDPNDLVRITATFSRTGSVPDGTIPIVTLTGAYGIIQSITPAQSDRSDVIVLNNNTTNVDQEVRIRFTVYNEQGLPVSSPEQIVIMKGVTVTPVISLTAGTTTLKVSTSNDTNENNRNALNPGGPSEPTGTTANRTTLTVTLNITGLNANEQVTLTLSSTDLNGLFTVTAAQNGETGPLGRMDINLNADGSGNLNTTVQRAYWASTKAGNFVITAEVKRQNGAVIGRASLNITQNPGNPAQVFLTTDPPRLAVSTVTTEPTAARVIATLFDANNNPVPNWWTFFQLQPVPVNMNPDFTDGESIGIPSVSDGVLDPFAVRTDSGGVAVSLIRSINTCQPVRIRAIADANNNGNLEGSDGPDNSYDTVYYVPLTNASAVVDYNSVTRDIIVTVTPATALPPNTAIWVCRYAVAGYAVDNDGDGRFDEDPMRDGTDEDGDGRDGEDGPDTISPRYYRVTVTEPGRLVVPAFPLGVREIGIVNVRIFIYTKDGTMLRIRIDRVQRP